MQVDKEGRVFAWGKGDDGLLGTGEPSSSLRPRLVEARRREMGRVARDVAARLGAAGWRVWTGGGFVFVSRPCSACSVRSKRFATYRQA